MPSNCCAVGCSNNLNKGIKTYRLPIGKNDQQRLQLWLSRIKRQDNFNHTTARLCAEHFEMDQFEPNIPGKLKRTAVPTIFSHGVQPKHRMPPKERATFHAQNDPTSVQEQAESVVPDLDIVKKEPVDYTEECFSSAAQNIPSVESSSGFTLSLKSEPTDDCVDDMTIPVNSDGITPSIKTSTVIVESSLTSRSHAYVDNREPPPKRPNLLLSSSTGNTEVTDVFSVFGNFVAAKLRSFTNRRLQADAQHRITNLLFEMEMKDLNSGSLPVISKISSLQKPLLETVALPSNSNISRNSSLQPHVPPTVTLSPSLTISKVSSLQTQTPVTATLPPSSAIRFVSLQTQWPTTVTTPSSSTSSSISSLKTQLPATVTLPFNSEICGNLKSQAQLPGTVMLPSCSAISNNSSSQMSLPATRTLPSSSTVSRISNLQTPLPRTVTLPSNSVIPVIIPITMTNTRTIYTQVVRPTAPKFAK